MAWVDTHCHLQLDGRPPLELLERAVDVDWVVVPGVDAASSRSALELAEQRPGAIFASAGLHPHDAKEWRSQANEIESLATRAVAIGETGLDFYRNLSPPDIQRESFRAQLQLALSLRKPVIVHCRDAFADVYDLLAETAVEGLAVLHCWTGGRRWTRRFLDLGVTFSYAGPVAFETGQTVREGAAVVPPDRAMVETDTPFLSPPPHRSEPNEPARVALVGAALAAVWGLPVMDVAKLTTARATQVFQS